MTLTSVVPADIPFWPGSDDDGDGPVARDITLELTTGTDRWGTTTGTDRWTIMTTQESG